MRSLKTPPRPLSGFEIVVIIHTGVFLVGTTWAFGGNTAAVRPPLALWGSLGALITVAAIVGDKRVTQISLRPLKLLWPLALFNALVLLGALTPLLREIATSAGSFLTTVPVSPWRPASAEPDLARRALWLFDAMYLACFNLILVIRHRRALRGLLLLAGGNALALSIFGTIQKLLGFKGLYFGLYPWPNDSFFASFFYHNHWGAFIVLMSAVALALVRHYGERPDGRDFFHTPAFAGMVAVLLFAITVPLSGSRSCFLLLAVLLGGAFLAWTKRLVRQRRSFGESVGPPLLGAGIAILLAIAGIWYLAGEVVISRMAKTEEQVAVMRQRGDIGGRNILYEDTLRMARDRPWFGWGMASYPHVFWFYNTQEPNPQDHLPVFYHDAHSDWLQSLAEHGLVGSALLALCALVPLSAVPRTDLRSPIVRYLFAGCGLLLLYAWIEFPFGNVAVVLSWWFCFFIAVRYAQLGSKFHRGALESAAPAPTP